MFAIRQAALAALITLALAGCGTPPPSRTMGPEASAAIQPLDVHIGIPQPELYAEFERSTLAASGAVACGIVPGLGVLLAAACGGAMGAMDATINAERAKTADELVRPLKDAILDTKMDQLLTDSLTASLQAVPKMQYASMKMRKTADAKADEETFRASTTSATMFVNMDYRISSDFSTVVVSGVGLVFPRSTAARTAMGKPAQLPEPGKGNPLMAHDAAFRSDVIYRGRLPSPVAEPAGNINAWKADNAQLLRAALGEGARQVARLIAEDVQRAPNVELPVLGKADNGTGAMGDVVWEKDGAQLIRDPVGSFIYKTTVSVRVAKAAPVAAQNPAAMPAAPTQ